MQNTLRLTAPMTQAAQAASAAIVIEPEQSRSITEWTPSLIRAARVSADAGNLELAADFCEWAIGDDRVAASLATRTNGLVSLPIQFEPARGLKRAVRALEAGEDWWAAYQATTLAQLLAWGRFLGVGLAYQRWVPRGDGIGRLIPEIRVWHPRNLRRDTQRGTWKVRTANRGEIDITPGDGNWILFAPYGESRPWAFGAWRSVSYWRLLKQYAIEDWGFYSGKNAGGWNVATFNGANEKLATKETRKELANDMFEAQANASIALPPGYDIKKVESTANTWETYRAQKDAADVANAVSLLGQNLSTEVSGPVATGATLHGKVLQVYVVDDNEKLHACIRDQSLSYWAEFNFGNPGLAPWTSYDVTPPEDEKRKADVAKTRAEAAKSLATIGCFTKNEVREAAGHEPLEQGGDELIVTTPTPSPPAQQQSAQATRILIGGGPRVGKTTLSRRLAATVGCDVRHTDDLIERLDWSATSDEVAQWLNRPGPWIIEGVAVARALRKWLAASSTNAPCDHLYWSSTARETQSAGQSRMHDGCEMVFAEIRDELVRRGVVIHAF